MGAASVTSIELVLSRTCWSADAGSNGTGQGADSPSISEHQHIKTYHYQLWEAIFERFNKTCDQQ